MSELQTMTEKDTMLNITLRSILLNSVYMWYICSATSGY